MAKPSNDCRVKVFSSVCKQILFSKYWIAGQKADYLFFFGLISVLLQFFLEE